MGVETEKLKNKSVSRARYSDDEKASALALLAVYGGNVKRTSRLTGVPRSTLTAWAQGRGAGAGVAELCHLKKGALADRLEEAARAMLDPLVLRPKIEAASLLDLMKAFGICVDKMLLLRASSGEMKRV